MEKELTMPDLVLCFDEAAKSAKNFIGVKVSIPAGPKPEVIINEFASFESKKQYYMKAYDYYLNLLSYPAIHIIGFASGDTYKDIQDQLA